MGVDVLRSNLRGKLCSLCIGYMLSFTIRKSGNQTVRERSSIAETLDRLKRTVCLAHAVLEFFKKRKREKKRREYRQVFCEIESRQILCYETDGGQIFCCQTDDRQIFCCQTDGRQILSCESDGGHTLQKMQTGMEAARLTYKLTDRETD